MCLLSVYFNDNPGEDEYQVIIASNRDEHLRRATKPASFWGENNDCLGGLDAEAGTSGGTWLAMSKITGRIGVLVNIAQKDGTLVTDYISSDIDTHTYLSKVNEDKNEYNGFHLVLMERRWIDTDSNGRPMLIAGCLKEKYDDIKLYLVSQGMYQVRLLSASMEDTIRSIDPGVFVIGNSHFLKPWPKVTYAEDKFRQLIKTHNRISEKDLLMAKMYDYLGDKTSQDLDDNFLGQLGPDAGTVFKPDGTKLVQVTKPEWLNAINVTNDLGFGTRTHTLILIDKHGNCEFHEKTLDVKFPKPSTEWISSKWAFLIEDCMS